MPIDNRQQLFEMAQNAANHINKNGQLSFTHKQIEDYFISENIDPAAARTATLNAYGSKVQSMFDQGLEPEKIRQVMDARDDFEPEFTEEIFQSLQGPRQLSKAEQGVRDIPVDPKLHTSVMDEYTPEALAAMTKQIYADEVLDLQDMASLLNSSFKSKTLDTYKDDLDVQIQNTLRKLGLNVEKHGSSLYIDKTGEGNWEELTPGILDELKASKFNIGGAILGGIAGAAVSKSPAGAAAGAIFGGGRAAALAALAGTGAGAAAGGVLGGASGAVVDAINNSLVLREELYTADFWRKMQSAGKSEAILGTLGATAIHGSIALGKGLWRGFDLVLRGNKIGAYDHMKRVMGLDDDQVKKIIEEFNDIAESPIGENYSLPSEAIQTIPLTQPGGEALVGAASKFNTVSGAEMLRSIGERSRQLGEEISTISHNANAPVVIKNLLDAHDKAVKDFYTYVKGAAKDASDISAYKFDYDKLAIEPVLQKINDNITNPAMQSQFEFYTKRVRKLGGYEEVVDPAKPSKTIIRRFRRSGPKEITVKGTPSTTISGNKLRSFSDLLDLRRTINDFKYNRRIKSAVDFDAVNNVLSKIDSEINRAAPQLMNNGKEWLQAWNEANLRYSKMKKLEKNALARIFRTPGANPKEIIRRMGNKVSAIDGTFMEVIHALPMDKRPLAEGAVLDLLKSKYTVGVEEGFSAVHFPQLAEELKYITFTTPEAKSIARTIQSLAKVFKNDVNLYQVSGSIEVPRFQSYLTTDPIIRAKYEIASTVFNRIRQHIPGEEGKKIALVKNLAKFLEEPKKIKNIEALRQSLPRDPDLEIGIKRLITQEPKAGEMGTYPNVKIYKVFKPGAKAEVYGRFTDETIAKTVASRTGSKIEGQLVTPQLIATEEDILKAGKLDEMPKVTLEELAKNKMLVRQLKAQGFIGMALKDPVGPRFRPDTIMFK